MFDILNSRTYYAKDYKSGIDKQNIQEIEEFLAQFKEYVFELKTLDGCPLHRSRRKTFVIGLIGTLESVLELSRTLLLQADYKYILTFRFSQDHIETLFSKIRRMGGFNNNPTVIQLKAALRKLLCKQSIESSTSANTLDCQSTTGVFQLKWSKRYAPVETSHDCILSENEVVDNLPELNHLTNNIIYYISGFIVHAMQGRVSCTTCLDALVATAPVEPHIIDHHYSCPPQESFALLTFIKNRGGLTIPSEFVFKIVQRAESIFRQKTTIDPNVILTAKNSKQYLISLFSRSIIEDQPCTHLLPSCDIIERGSLPHSQQLIKVIVSKYFDLRLKHYNRVFNRDVVHHGSGSDRSRLSRMIIFKHQ